MFVFYDPLKQCDTMKNLRLFSLVFCCLLFCASCFDTLEEITIENKQSKKFLRKNVSAGWLKFDKLSTVFPENDFSSFRHIKVKNTLNSLGTLYFNTSKVKGNKMYGAASLSLGPKATQPMDYFFYLIDDLRRIND